MIERIPAQVNNLAPRRRGQRSWLAVPAAIALMMWGSSGCDASGPGRSEVAQLLRPKEDFDRSLPKIDVHMHIAPVSANLAQRIMAEQGIRVGLNASGGLPSEGLEESLEIAQRSAGRLRPLCNVDLVAAADPTRVEALRATIQDCKSRGGLGLKIPKALGLGVADGRGRLLAVDAPAYDALFDEAGAQGLPVLIHSGDPRAFFQPPTPDNERYTELKAHPGWSFFGQTPYGEPWPSWAQILDSFERRVARHPKTMFLGAHFGNAAEDPDRVARMLERLPNYFIDTAARVPEFGRHDSDRMRAFFMKHQDRVLFGSDLAVIPGGLILGSGGREPDPVAGAAEFFQAHWRYFESRRRGLKHPTPIQGAWTVDGVGLPREILEKVYWRNAARLFSLVLPVEPTPRGGN